MAPGSRFAWPGRRILVAQSQVVFQDFARFMPDCGRKVVLPTTKTWEEIMTNPTNLPGRQDGGSNGLDRRTLIRGAAALAATAATMKAASAATGAPLGQTGAPTLSTEPLPFGPLPGSPYPDSHPESS